MLIKYFNCQTKKILRAHFRINVYPFQIDNAHFMQQTPVPIYNTVSLILKKFNVFHWQRRFIIVSRTAPTGI